MICLLREVCAFEIGDCALIKGGIGADVQLLPSGQFTLNGVILHVDDSFSADYCLHVLSIHPEELTS